MSDSISPAKLAANRANAAKSSGPKNTTSTRFNAAKHGFLAEGVTELDDPETYRQMLRELSKQHSPVGVEEQFLVQRVALYMMRLLRAARLEAAYITSALNPPVHEFVRLPEVSDFLEGALLDPGLPAPLERQHVEKLTNIFLRYETANENKLFRSLHELERLQRMRRGEQLPAPAAVEVAVHADDQGVSD